MTQTATKKPIDRILDAFTDAREGKEGWYSALCTGHDDKNASLSFREKENGGIIVKCHSGCTEEQILAGAGLQARDLYPQGNYRPKTRIRPKLELVDLAYDKGLPWQLLFNEGVNDGYSYYGQSVCSIAYYTVDGQEHTKVRVRLGFSGNKDSKWDGDTPGEMIAYGLHKLDMARKAGYSLIGEGESDAWTCWFHGIPYLGVPGATNEKCLNGVDLQDIPRLYIIREPDEAGRKFYSRVHARLRKTGYTGEIYAIIFKKITGCKDPNELHKRLLKEKNTTFVEAITNALQQAIPDNALTDKHLLGSGHAAIDAAIRSGDKETLYHLAPEVVQLPALARQRMRLDIRTVFGKDFPMREFDELIAAEHQRIESEQRRHPVINSARTLMHTKFNPIDWIAEGVLPPGIIALAGKQKIGKSWLGLNVGLGVSTGGLIFGSISVKPGNVLYMALEDNDRRIQDRLETIHPPDAEMPEEFEYVTKWPRMDVDGLLALEDWLKSRPNPRLIIIDPWVKVKPRMRSRAGETGYDTDYEALEGIKQLADTYNVCILIFFHLRKEGAEDPFDELNATTGVTACADGFLSLKRGRGESEATLWGTGRDYKEDVDMGLSFSSGIWTYTGKGSEVALSQASKEVIDALKRAGEPLQPKAIAEILDIPAHQTGMLRKRLFDMKDRGEIINTGNGYIANIGNGGNEGNTSNGGNEGNGHKAGSVTPNPLALPPLPLPKTEVTLSNQPVGKSHNGSVTSVTPVTSIHNNNGHCDEYEEI